MQSSDKNSLIALLSINSHLEEMEHFKLSVKWQLVSIFTKEGSEITYRI